MAATTVAYPASSTIAMGDNGQPLFTCLSCNIAFPNAHDQRDHYRTEWHRYNAKRRVAQLPPIRKDVFDQKVVAATGVGAPSSASSSGQRGAGADFTSSAAATTAGQDGATDIASSSTKCDVCNKHFGNSNVLKDHLQSKKHKEQVLQVSLRHASRLSKSSEPAPPRPASSTQESTTVPAPSGRPQVQPPMTLNVPDNATEEEINQLIDAKVASATRIDPVHACLFCTSYQAPSTPTLEATLEHMQRAHGFFIPEREYLIDLPGLLTYLADKVTVGNICLYCNARGRSFASLEAVRKHMLDKSHCKIAYEAEDDVMELSDFYDFSSSYPDEEDEDAEWEDMDGVEEDDEDGGVDVEMDDGGAASSTRAAASKSSAAARSSAKRPSAATIGDTEYELVLPSGARLGHRALRRYYNQTLWSTPALQAQEELHRRRLLTASETGADGQLHNKALVVHNRGGKQNAVVAKCRGQAREATRHVREFRDVQRREAYKTRVAYTKNNQKHFRDPLLQ